MRSGKTEPVGKPKRAPQAALSAMFNSRVTLLIFAATVSGCDGFDKAESLNYDDLTAVSVYNLSYCKGLMRDLGFVEVERPNNLVARAVNAYSRLNNLNENQFLAQKCVGVFDFGSKYCVGISSKQLHLDDGFMECYNVNEIRN